MNLHDIMIESLKLMFASYDRDLALARIDDLKADSAYRDYIYNMPPAINRAFTLIESKGVLRENVVHYTADAVESNMTVRIPVRVIAENGKLGGELNGIRYRAAYGFNWVPFVDILKHETDTVVLPNLAADEQYAAYYTPKICRVSLTTPEDTEIPIPEGVASLIPYYVKGELYREEDVNEADKARGWFEAGLNEIAQGEVAPVGVSTVYGGLI